MNTVSPWAGLGQRTNAPPPKPAADDNDEDAFARPSVQRMVPAADAPSVIPVNPVTSPFDHPFRPTAGSAADSDDASAAKSKTEEPPTMPSKSAKPAATPSGGSFRVQACELLCRANDPLSRDDIGQLLHLDSKRVSNLLFQLAHEKRIERYIAKSGDRAGQAVYRITVIGRQYVAKARRIEGTDDAAPAPARRAKAAATPRRVKPVATTDPESTPPGPMSFRCAVFIDHSFVLVQDDVEIYLTPTEYAQLRSYLARADALTA